MAKKIILSLVSILCIWTSACSDDSTSGDNNSTNSDNNEISNDTGNNNNSGNSGNNNGSGENGGDNGNEEDECSQFDFSSGSADDFFEATQPEMTEETKVLMKQWRQNPTDENYRAFRNKVIENYENVLTRKNASLPH